jgi:hypothetical protein
MLEGEFAEQIVRSVRLLNDSVTNALQFGKPIVPAPTWISVYRLLEGIRVFLLHRMLLNLVLNALREIPTDGTVSLKGQVA